MKTPVHFAVWSRFLVVLTLGLLVYPSAAEDSVTWHRNTGKVDADVSEWNMVQLLENVAGSTGWHIFLDPGAIQPVSVKFRGLPQGEALRMMLGHANFMMVPKTNGTTELYVFRANRQQATQMVHPAAKQPAKPIANELVVTLKPGAKTKIDDLAKSLGAKVIGRMDAQNSYLLQFDDPASTQAARAQLASNPDVAGLDYNYAVDAPPQVQAASANSPSLDLKPGTNDNNNCQLVVGLIDTPVESLGANLDSFMKPQIHVAGTPTIDPTQITHGTAMAETILGAIQSKTGGNSTVRIQPVDVYGSSETTTTFDVANGIMQAVNNGANVINLSLGSSGDSQFLHNTIIQVSQQGIPLYAAAGNTPVTTPTYPAAYPEVVSVTASDPNGQIASYANRGSFIDMMVSGDNVVPFNGQSYLVEGTSTSTAFASGMAAGLADSNHACADQAQSLLQKSLPRASILKQ